MEDNMTTVYSTIPTTITPDTKNIALGLICTAIASFGFGTNYLPLKKFDTGDGMFFQLVLCTTIWVVGICANIILGSPEFYPLVMIGGVIWATGNILTVPIVRTVGLGIGFMIWGSTSIIIGWASGRFGWFGIKKQIPLSELLNYLGLACAFIRAIIFVFIKPEADDIGSATARETEHAPLVYGTDGPSGTLNSVSDIGLPRRVFVESDENIKSSREQTFFEKLPPIGQRILGITFACIAGVCYGLTFTPAIYIQDWYKGASQNSIDYAYAQFCGILATGWFYFVIYCIALKNKPILYPQAILPGVVSGFLWAIAQLAFFVANQELTETVTFPIIASVPCVIAAICGIIFFGEIKGRKNFILLALAFVVTFGGATLSGLSVIYKT